MAHLVLYPRVGSHDSIRCWLGAFGGPPGALNWTLDGGPADPDVLRPMTPVHRHGARTWSGVFEFRDVAPGKHRVKASRAAGGATATMASSPIPAQVPDDDWLRIQLVSCYHRAEDSGSLTRTVENLAPADRPDLTILMGDQVYLDLPTLANFPDNEAKLARMFEEKYARNWTRSDRGLGAVLGAAPNVFAPDDHEYWNNFPHRATVVQNSWKQAGRDRWRRAADAVYDAFQVATPQQRGEPVVFDVDPVSFLVLDQRSGRNPDLSAALSPGAIEKVEEWVDRLILEKKFGFVVSGQPFLDKAAGRIQGAIADRTLVNYQDYGRTVRALAKLSRSAPVVLLTGDVHWGRATEITDGARVAFQELICSPAAQVSTVGVDQIKTVRSILGGLFGRRERWPRHGDADPPDTQAFALAASPRKLDRPSVKHTQKGDQIATLYLRRSADDVEMKVVYREVHRRPGRPAETRLRSLARRV